MTQWNGWSALNQSIENLQTLITAEMLKQMYQYKDHNAFARQLIEMAIDPVVAEREYVELPSEDEYSAINEQIPKGNQKDRDISSLWW